MSVTIGLYQANGQVRNHKNDHSKEIVPLMSSGENFAYLASKNLVYQEGDGIKITLEQPGQFIWVKVDECLPETLIYISGRVWNYRFPLGEKEMLAQSDVAFKGTRHYISVRKAKDYEIAGYRNLSYNPHDLNQETGGYPHASANVETRREATFFACNAINGVLANYSHGSYPFVSWGINQQLDACFRLDFGRLVAIDRLLITLRADFPHDSYWTRGTVRFSDGSEEELHFQKQAQPQEFLLSKRQIEWLTFSELIQDEDNSPFPALTEFSVFGTEVEK